MPLKTQFSVIEYNALCKVTGIMALGH